MKASRGAISASCAIRPPGLKSTHLQARIRGRLQAGTDRLRGRESELVQHRAPSRQGGERQEIAGLGQIGGPRDTGQLAGHVAQVFGYDQIAGRYADPQRRILDAAADHRHEGLIVGRGEDSIAAFDPSRDSTLQHVALLQNEGSAG